LLNQTKSTRNKDKRHIYLSSLFQECVSFLCSGIQAEQIRRIILFFLLFLFSFYSKYFPEISNFVSCDCSTFLFCHSNSKYY